MLRLAVSVALTIAGLGQAWSGECLRCKLEGKCPVPVIRSLMNCSAEEATEKAVPIPAPAAASGWVDTPCGRIQSRQTTEAAKP